jgi:DNA-binding CsgD family transcriptional regulator
MSERLVLGLTEQIYEAATGGIPWATVGEDLMRLVQASSATLMVDPPAGGAAEVLFRGDIPTDAALAYHAHYRTVDLWTNRAREVAVDRGNSVFPVVWTSGTLVSDAEFLRSEFYGDFGRNLGLRYVVGTVLSLGEIGLMPIGLHRPAGSPPFERAQAQLLELLLPHLRRAMQLRHRLGSEGPAVAPSFAALDALAAGVLVVDADLHVLVANAAAEAMARPGGAICLVRASRGRGVVSTVARALHHSDNAALSAIVRATAQCGAPGGAVPLRDGEGATVVAALVSPLPRRLSAVPGDLAGRVAGQALILMRDLRPTRGDVQPQLLRELFGLTQAEAEVALTLVGGATKESVAELRRAQVSTIRTQVRSILAKTGAVNLRGLDRVLASLRSH